MPSLTHKRGATFSPACTYQDAAGAPIAVTVMTITSQVRRPGGRVVQSLAVVKADQTVSPGRFVVTATAAETALWPIEPLIWDVRIAKASGEVVYSETVDIVVVRQATEGGS